MIPLSFWFYQCAAVFYWTGLEWEDENYFVNLKNWNSLFHRQFKFEISRQLHWRKTNDILKTFLDVKGTDEKYFLALLLIQNTPDQTLKILLLCWQDLFLQRSFQKRFSILGRTIWSFIHCLALKENFFFSTFSFLFSI